ncbi:hypothetical protein MSG28_013037 [Choristoneura fumiferana]|uniref:Uncharacterized protein n=2 Tax=Choristoneura fumiferana TaxID=7141 RepID=A0ACC0KSP5_CHOFU|nr:hypothetical protein MSG28_013037 [Choristoneura fumiferana]KAI8439191.1 hypothetical protein MSG28_013037 [Choristoneura fumiferana]
MQGLVSDKTFHLKWNNHLQNLSQLFTTIYSSSALADVTLSCRDGTLKAHKLVLSACSPYFEQIFRDNPCQHPIVILKGIPFSEINLLVEFMYKGSVDVQELDLQSLMHTASELEIRGLAYEARDNAAQLLNVNLEYPTYTQTQVSQSQTQAFPQARTDVERLKQIHMYQQSMMRAEEIRRRRRDDTPGTHTAVNNILAAAAREMEEARHASRGERVVASIQTELDQAAAAAAAASTPELKLDDERPKKRSSILTPDDDKLRAKKKMTEDPTVDMANEATATKRENNSEVMSGMVRTTHRESGHLVFTPSGDVMLPPRAANPVVLNSTLEPVKNELQQGDLVDPPRRGRGRPRKTPLPLTPKIKKKRGRPPKTSLDLEGCVLTGGTVMGLSQVPMSPSGQQLLLKRKRGRPPKNYLMPNRPDGRPNENYNATNLPFGDFSYLTEMMYNPALAAYGYGVTSVDPDRNVDADQSATTDTSHDRTIDVSDSSSDDDDSTRVEPEENVPPVAVETQIMTVGDCQIVKLPPNNEEKEDKVEPVPEAPAPPVSTPSSVTITPITTVGDCTIRPVENNT